MVSRLQTVPFDGTDFPLWKFKMESLLLGMDLIGVVEGTETTGAHTQRKKALAYSMIVLSLRDETIKHAITTKRGECHELWIKLSEEYERNSRSSKISLRRQLFEVMGKEGELDEIVGKIDVLCGRLQFLGVNVSDDEKLAVLLSSVPRELDSVSAVLELQGDSLTFPDAVKMMKDFEGRFEGRSEGKDNKAMKVGGRKDKSMITCFQCNKKGHYASECQSKPDKADAIRINPDKAW
jgi:hypothetical protein